MDLYTTQIYKSRNDPDLLDITVKGKHPIGKVFAPSWDIVMGHKDGKYTDAQYISVYYTMMLDSYAKHRKVWDWVLAQPRVVLACYCPTGNFCHRHLLVEYLTSPNLGANYLGEL